mmetsp:Transcript_23664/g.44700  ORF Transcript_23664/g.44700 Transcript_23664/m.44700 type:complete len:182 (+) Transcript_23664:51-596(+)
MARKVGFGSKRPRSTAKRLAQKAPTVRMLPKAKRDYIIDDRPSQRRKGRRGRDVTLPKGKYETIPGTRIQLSTGGNHVRIVIQDGKIFDPQNVRGVRRHLKKLADEAAELARIHGTKEHLAKAKTAGETAAKAADSKSRQETRSKTFRFSKQKRKRKASKDCPTQDLKLTSETQSLMAGGS